MKKIYFILLSIVTLLSLVTIFAVLSNTKNDSNYYNFLSSKLFSETFDIEKKTTNILYEFDSPILAYSLLQSLEMNKPIIVPNLSNKIFRLKPTQEPNYCKEALKAFTDNPAIIFKQNNFWTDYPSTSILRRTIKKMGHDLPGRTNFYGSRRVKRRPFTFSPKIAMYFVAEYYHIQLLSGKHFACSHQMYSKLYSVRALGNKGLVAKAYEDYLSQYQDRPYCIERNIPLSFLLTNETQCHNFFNYLKSPGYKEERKNGVVFIQKDTNTHMGSGVHLFDEGREKAFKMVYARRNLCGNVDKIQMQKYIHNPLLLYGHKFDFRVYMLITSVNPVIVYYHDGFLRVSLQIFNMTSTNRATHFTNTHIAEDLFKYAKVHGNWSGMTEAELRDFQTWNFTRLHNYLYSIQKINDPDWLQNYLRPQLMKAIIHILRSTQHTITRATNTYQLWGMDFIMDDNLKLWFIEANPRPGIMAASPMRKKFMEMMVEDMFTLLFAHLRSRMKRVVLYVNQKLKSIPLKNYYNNGVAIPNSEKEKEFFASRVNTNYMDPEFEPKITSFYKIIDENYENEEKYMGFMKKECI